MKRILLAAILVALSARPVQAGVAMEHDTCRQVFDNPRAEAIACQTSFRLDAASRERLSSVSFGFLTDLACTASVAVTRSDIVAKVRRGGEVAIPPQRFTCRLATQSDALPVSFSLAPRVTLAGGQAVDARLGIGNVTGVPEPLAAAVSEFLNSDPGVKKSLVDAANQILPNLPK